MPAITTQRVELFGLDTVNGQALGSGYVGDDPVVVRLTDQERDTVQAAFDRDERIELDVERDAFVFGGA